MNGLMLLRKATALRRLDSMMMALELMKRGDSPNFQDMVNLTCSRWCIPDAS